MGGKHKQAQRTKNNARPSSSGRSAELLGSSRSQFAGFSGMKEIGLTLPIFSLSPEDMDTSIDTNFQLVFKKMNKKDSTTKLKALQEFADLVTNSDVEAVKAILPFWPRLYGILATDTEHRVREAANNAHYQIILKNKKNIAPYLKQLIAPWFTSQYDTYPPAASAAMKAFQATFPANKIEGAIVFCQEEILNYIYENLTVQTPQTLSTPKTISPEEAEAKYERILISSLQGYTLYLNSLSAKNIEQASELNIKIISTTKFWKLSKYKLASVRGLWFGVLSTLCQKAPFVLSDKNSQVVSTVFGGLNESEPTVLPNVWDAVLLTIASIKDWWTYVNVEKLFCQKLWKVLREGGQGNAAVIYPNLLPLLSKLPPNIDINLFYNSFFENMRLGLNQKSVLASKSEVSAVITTIIECLQYVILKNQSDINFCEKMIETHLILLINWSLIEEQIWYKTIFNQVTLIVQYWSRNQKDYENYIKYLEYFWTNINELMRLVLSKTSPFDKNKISSVSNKQVELLQSLKHIAKPKKQLKVKFLNEDVMNEGNEYEEIKLDLHSDESYLNSLNNLACNICVLYVNEINRNQLKELLDPLVYLIQNFENEMFLRKLNNLLTKNDQNDSISNIYNNVLVKWLKSSYLCSKTVVDLIFLLLKYLNLEEIEEILKSFLVISNQECLSWCLVKTFSHPYNKNPLILEWLTNDKITEHIIKLAEKEIFEDSSPELNVLFKLLFTENEDGDLLISREAVRGIIEKFNTVLLNPEEYSLTLDSTSSLASYISTIIYSESSLLKYGDELLLALFTLSCNDQIDSEILSKDTFWELSTAWQDVIVILSKGLEKKEFMNLVLKFSNIIQNKFISLKLDDNVDNLIDVIVKCIRSIFQNLPLMINDICKLFFEQKFEPLWKNQIMSICKLYEFLNNKLCSPFDEIKCDEIKHDFDERNIPKYFLWKFLQISILTTNVEDFDDDIDEEDLDNINTNKIIECMNNHELIMGFLYDLAIAGSFLENYTMAKYHTNVHKYYDLLKEKTELLIENCDSKDIDNLNHLLLSKISTDSWFWCKSLYLLYTDLKSDSKLEEIYNEFINKLNTTNNLPYLHLTQVFGKHLTYSDVKPTLNGTIEKTIMLKSLINDINTENDNQIIEVFSKIEELRNDNIQLFLYENPILIHTNWLKTQEICEIIRLLAKLIEVRFDSLHPRHWDLSVISLVSWVDNCLKAKSLIQTINIQALMLAISKLFSSIDNKLKQLKKTSETTNNRVNEWEDLFLPGIHTKIVQMWLCLPDELKLEQDGIPLISLPLIQEFGNVMNNFNYEFIFKNGDDSLPKWSKILKRCCSLLLSPIINLQLWGYNMLIILVPGLVDIDTVAVNTNTPHKKGLIFEQFKEILVHCQDIVNALLQVFKLGDDSCTVEPFTDSYTYTLAYLLLWNVLFNLCETSSTELRYQYADWLRKEDLLKNLLDNLFRLMPTEILNPTESKSKKFINYFLEKPVFNMNEPCNSEKLEHMVCWVYVSSLTQLPALVRQWWSGTEPRVAQIVEKVTSFFVSSSLCIQELSDVSDHEHKFKNMVVKIVPSVREVIAVYTVDEAQMELVITLPSNYPLGVPDVQCNKQIGGTSHKQWLMQLKKCILHQNGRIWDGLLLWNNNLDKKFDGVEECYICFAVLHPGTYQIPKLLCQICKKKFHSACLYKWFSTSNKSSCPICRNLF